MTDWRRELADILEAWYAQSRAQPYEPTVESFVRNLTEVLRKQSPADGETGQWSKER